MSLYRRCRCDAPPEVDCGHAWWCKFKYGGIPYRESTEQTNRGKAAEVEKRRYVAVRDEGTGIAKPKAMRLKAHLEDYLEWALNDHPASVQKDAETLLPAPPPVPGATRDKRREGPRAKSFLEVIGNKPLNRVSNFDIERWRNALAKTVIRGRRKMSRSTINRRLTIVRGCFSKAVDWKRLRESPVADIEPWDIDENEIIVLTTEQRVIALTKLPTEFAMYCRVTLETLARISEVLYLKPSDLGPRSIQRRLKGGKVRPVPCSASLIADLRAFITDPKQRYIFSGDAEPKPRSVASQMTKAFREVGLRGISHHKMRHTGVTDMLDDGINPKAIMEYAGWTSLRMLLRYGHVRDAELLKAVTGTAARNNAALAEGVRRKEEEDADAAQKLADAAAAAQAAPQVDVPVQSVPKKTGGTKRGTR